MRGLLAQAGWRELPVPDELRTHPQAARAWLQAERARLDTQSGAECQTQGRLRDRFGPRLHEARLRLALARPLAEAALAGRARQGRAGRLVGLDSQDASWTLCATRWKRDFTDATGSTRASPPASEVADVPSLVRYPGWLTPFVPLVKSYGVPRYGEFDPALPFAFTYLLLFGAMFGDVGHGAVILLLAAGLYRRLGRMAWVGMAAGAVSMVFGLLYGSIFGYEDVIAADLAVAAARSDPRADACRRLRCRLHRLHAAGQRAQQVRRGPRRRGPVRFHRTGRAGCSISARSACWQAWPAWRMSPDPPGVAGGNGDCRGGGVQVV